MTDTPTGPMAELIERWKPVRGFEDRYEVSNLGRVRSAPSTGYNYFLSTFGSPSRPKDYPAISLRRNGFRERRAVHRIVADAFLPPRPSHAHVIRHLDGNPKNNRADNLAWGTQKENADDRERHGATAKGNRHGMFGVRLPRSRNGYAKLTDEEVSKVLSALGTQREIARKFGVSQKCIWRIRKVAALKAKESTNDR